MEEKDVRTELAVLFLHYVTDLLPHVEDLLEMSTDDQIPEFDRVAALFPELFEISDEERQRLKRELYIAIAKEMRIAGA